MESKRKKPPVPKAPKATHGPKKSLPQDKPTEIEALIKYNGDLVEALTSSEAWREIAFPLLQEAIAGVSGRLTNGRFHHGSLTREISSSNALFVSGYQKALMDFHNNLMDFMTERDKLKQRKKDEEKEAKAPLYNPFLEEEILED